MRRRAFITLLGGAAAWPLTARAQQPDRARRIGVVMNLAADDPEGQARLAAFLQGLQEAGWAVGRNVRIDVRWATSDPDRNRKLAAELVALAPDAICASTGQVVMPLRQVTRTVPRPVLFQANSARARNGWSCSRTSLPTFPALPFFTARTTRRECRSSPPSRPWPPRSEWNPSESACATPARSSGLSRPSRVPQTAA